MSSSQMTLLLATLTSGSDVAREGLAHELNRSRWLRPYPTETSVTDLQHDEDAQDDRETTPAVENMSISVKISLENSLWPRNPQEGFIFGNATSGTADIIIAKERHYNVSRQHFAVQIKLESQQLALLLTVLSRNGVRVVPARGPPTILTIGQNIVLRSEDRIEAGLAYLKVWLADPLPSVAHQQRRLRSRAYANYIRQLPPNVEASSSATETRTLDPQSRLTLSLEPIGSGTFGTVYHASDTSRRSYAVKVFHSNRKFPSEIRNQISIVSGLQHKHIVRIFPSVRVATHVMIRGQQYMVMERLEGSLADLFPPLPRHRREMPTVDEVEVMFKQILDAVAYMHREGLTHRDLKPDNILVRSTDPLEVAITDFDSLGWSQPLISFHSTPKYTAPEMAEDFRALPEGENFYTNKVDIWSIGVMLLEYSIIGGISQPSCQEGFEWRDLPVEHLINAYNRTITEAIDRLHLVIPEHRNLWDIARLMLSKTATSRPNAEQCLAFLENAIEERTQPIPPPSPTELATSSDESEDDDHGDNL